MKDSYKRLLVDIEKMDGNTDEILLGICELLKGSVAHYDWVGFYMLKNGKLNLGPYSGAPTEHNQIAIGQGVCGQAIERESTMIVADVRSEDNYLACSLDVRSEIVVPIFKDSEIIGEIDIDSHRLDAFDQYDKEFLEAVCEHVAGSL